MRVLLCGLQSPINIGSILRVAETFAVGVDILDVHRVLADPAKAQTIADFSCGAFQRGAYRLVDTMRLAPAGGRLIATWVRPGAASLTDFRFLPGDSVAIGNEYDGLSEAQFAACDAAVHIPMADVETPKLPSASPIDPTRRGFDGGEGPTLSAAMTAGILCYTWFARQR